MLAQGKLIVVEGGEGSGKSSFVTLFRDDPRFEVTREPGGSPYAEHIRALILDPQAKHASGMTMLYLFAAARCDHFEKTIAPALQQGKHVISDRMDASTFAYQIYGQEAFDLKPLFHLLRKSWLSICEPAHYIFFDVTPEIGIGRRHKEMQASSEETNHFDNRKLDFHHRIREGFLEFLEDEPHSIIDANRAQKVVWEEGKRVIESLIV